MSNLIAGLLSILTIKNFLIMNLGVLIGVVFGAIPGLSVNIALVLFLPMTFGMNPITSIIMMLGIYAAGSYGGSVSAILLNTPGTNSAMATLIDGYPLAKKGQANKALEIALISSVIGGMISALILLVGAPQIARFTLQFGPAEYFTLAVFGLSIIAGVSGKSMLKGLLGGCLGVIVSMIGLDACSNIFRFTFGSRSLINGINLLPALIGLFAISEIYLNGTYNTKDAKSITSVRVDKDDRLSFAEFKKILKTIIYSGLIGTIIGAIPGTGGGIAAFLSHSQAQRRSKTPEEFGKGAIEGVAAAEAGNNGTVGATLIPLVTLGIPGDTTTAILIGAFMMHGLVPGPMLFKEQGPLIYAIMLSFFLINILMFFQGKYLQRFFAHVTKVPYEILAPLIIVMCSAGAYTFGNNIFYIKVIIVFGVIGYFVKKMQFSPVPVVLGIVLGPIAEINLRRALLLSKGSYSIFVTRPISLFFVVLTMVSMVMFFRINARKNKKPSY